MLDLSTAQDFLTRLSVARVTDDVDTLVSFFTDDGVFRIVGFGEAATGKEAIRSALQGIVQEFEFLEWKQTNVFVNGNDLAARHRLKVRHRKTGTTTDTETSEFLVMSNGHCSSFVQFADTALIQDLQRG